MFEFVTITVFYLIICLALFLKRFYARIKRYPKGPTPLPVFGNALSLRKRKSHPVKATIALRKKYGSVYTYWLGNNPIVVIFDLDLAKKCFNTSAFAGRPQMPFIKMFCTQRGTDILFADYGKSWRCLRNVTHSAMRKFALKDKFSKVTCEIVDHMVQLMLNNEGTGQPFSPIHYIQLTIYNIVCYSVFSKKYNLQDPEFKSLKNITKTIFEFGNRGIIIQFIPLSALIYLPEMKNIYRIFKKYKHFMIGQFKLHEKTYEEGVVRNFTDALIEARNDALNNGKESAPYLTNYSLICSLWDLLFAGVDTTQITVQWMFLLLANYPLIQKRMRHEIEEVIGDRMPDNKDIEKCVYVTAFVYETLRFRPVLPFGVIHKTTRPIELDGLTLPANTCVVVHQQFIMNDKKYWSEPHVFRPERFLSSDPPFVVRPREFIPFSIGQRRCLGERLAINNLFIVLARFLQMTIGYEIALENGISQANLDPDPTTAFQFQYPRPFKIQIIKST